MPQLRQYISQEASRGGATLNVRATPQGPDVSGLVRGVADAGNTYERVQAEQARTAEQLRLVQERERKALEIDEARVFVANKMSEAQVTWTERLQKAQGEVPKGAAGFTESTLKEFDSWATESAKGAAHPEAKKLLEHDLRKMRLGLHADAFKFEIGQRNKALVSDFETGLDNDRRAVMADPSRFADTAGRRIAAAQALNLPAEVKGKMVEVARESLAYDAAQGLVDRDAAGFLERAGVRAAKGGKGKGGQQEDAAARIAGDSLLSSLSPERLRQVVDRASMLVSQQEQAREVARMRAAAEGERRLKHAEAEFNVFQSLADKGTALDPAYIDRVSKATAGTPYASGIRALAEQAKETGGLAAQPVAVVRATLDAIDAQIAQGGRSPAMDKRREQVEKVLKGTESDLAADPLRAGLQRGWIVDLPPLDMSQGPQGLAQQMPDRVALADRVSQRAGRAVAPLTDDEAVGLNKMLGALPPDQKANTLALLAGSMPPAQGQALARQMDKHDRALSLALAAGMQQTSQGRPTAELILKGAQFAKDKSIKEDKGAEFGLSAQIAREVGDAIPGQARQDVIDAARFIYMGKQGEGQTVPIRAAVHLAIGGEIVEHNGRRLPVPPGMNTESLQERLLRYPEKAISAQATDGYVILPGGRPMGVPEFLSALPSAQLEPAGMGRYMVRSGGSLVTGKERRPIVVDLR